MATAEATREFSKETRELGDKIVGLTLKAAKELSDYLDEVHGIKPAAGGAVMMAGPVGGGGGAAAEPAAEKTEFDVVLDAFGARVRRRGDGPTVLRGPPGDRRPTRAPVSANWACARPT